MTTKRVAIDRATTQQLLDFATNTLGLAIKDGTSHNAMLGKIRQAWTEPDFPVEQDEPVAAVQDAPTTAMKPAPVEQVNSRAMVDGTSRTDPRVTLVVQRAEGRGGDRPVPVSVNGVCLLIPRGESVTVAYRYYEALKNAIQTVYEQNVETMEMVARDVPSYPFNVVAMPPEEEVERWRAALNRVAA